MSTRTLSSFHLVFEPIGSSLFWEDRNEFLASQLDLMFNYENLDKKNRVKNIMKISDHNNGAYLFKFAVSKKAIIINRDLLQRLEDDYPYIYVYIDTNPESQKVLIENKAAVGTLEQNSRRIIKLINHKLRQRNLKILLTRRSTSNEAWEQIERIKDSVTSLKFEFISPNLALLDNLPDKIYQAQKRMDASSAKLITSARKDSTLKQLSKENIELGSFVNALSKGLLNIFYKIKGKHKYVELQRTPLDVSIDEETLNLGSIESLPTDIISK